MATKFAQYVPGKHGINVPQSEPLDSRQVKNDAGGYVYEVDAWSKLNRFLLLGSDGNSYYASEKKLVTESATNVIALIKQDGPRVVAKVVEVSDKGKAYKNDPALFVLALAITHGDDTTKQAVTEALPKVARIPSHLFSFVGFTNSLRGWGRALKTAVRRWYASKDPSDLGYQVTKYQQRDGWSHLDVLRLAHINPKSVSPQTAAIFSYLKAKKKGTFSTGGDGTVDVDLPLSVIVAEEALASKDIKRIVHLIGEYNIPREVIPTEFLNSPKVWEALLPKMPLTALIRNLATMTRAGIVGPLSDGAGTVARRITDTAALKKARIHPIQVLAALKTYEQGHGERGSNTWTPTPSIVAALNDAFYASFDAVEPVGKPLYIGIDVSGSMTGGQVGGVPGLTPHLAAAALAMVVARRETNYHIAGFTSRMVDLGITAKDSLRGAMEKTYRSDFGSTDCAQPMLDAMAQGMKVAGFAILTDNETHSAAIHPMAALRQYRAKTGIPARLAVMGMTLNAFSIADPTDSLCLDMVGFSTDSPAVLADFLRGEF